MLSDDQKLSDYAAGATDGDLAILWGCSPLAVRSWRLSRGLPKNGIRLATVCATVEPVKVEKKQAGKKRMRVLSPADRESLVVLASWLYKASNTPGTTSYQRVNAALECARYQLSGKA